MEKNVEKNRSLWKISPIRRQKFHKSLYRRNVPFFPITVHPMRFQIFDLRFPEHPEIAGGHNNIQQQLPKQHIVSFLTRFLFTNLSICFFYMKLVS